LLRPVRVSLLLLLFSILECKPLYQPQQTDPLEENPYKKVKIRVLTQDRGYPLGGPVDLKLEIQNLSEEPVTLDFNSNQLFDFKVFRKGREVWRWSYDKTFEKTGLRLAIYPKEIWSFQAEWDTKDNQRRWVLGGRYYIEGILNCSPPLKSEQAEIGLRD